MTGSLRTTARNPVAIALMGLLILVFLVLGVGGGGRFPDLFNVAHPDAVVTAGGHATTAQQYRKIFEQQKQHFEEQTKQPTTNDYLIRNGFDQQLVNQIALDQAQGEMLTRIGITPAPSLIDAQIKQIPVAFDRVTGRFSEKQFTQFLASQGLTPQEVQSDLTDELALRHFNFALGAGFKAPRAYAALTAVSAMQNRDVSYFVLDPRAIVPPAAPTDAQLLTFMKANAAQLTRPEMRTLTLVRFSAAALTPSIALSPAEIQKEFDFRKDSLSIAETRSFLQIPARGAADAAQVAKRLGTGEDPAAIARGLGVQPIVYTDKPRSAVPDGKLAAAAFALSPGQVSGPIQGELGFAVVKVTKVTPGKVATLDSARAKIVSDLSAKAAQKKAYELSQKYDDARQGGSNLADAATKAGVATITFGPVSAEGAGLDGKPNPLVNDKIAKAAFALRAGEDSDVQDTGPGEYFAVRVEKIAPPALPSIDEIRGPLTQAFKQQQMIAALRAKADVLMGQVRQGQSIDAVAKTVGASATHSQGMTLIQAGQYQAMGREFLTQVFGRKPGEVFAAGAPNGVFIAKLDAIRPGEVIQTAQFMESIRTRASQDYLRDLLTTTKAASEKAVKVSVNLNLARQTMGVDPATVTGPGQKNAPAKK